MSLELRIYVPGLDYPLVVEKARVQWVSEQIFGAAFFRMKASEQQRSEQVIAGLEGLNFAA